MSRKKKILTNGKFCLLSCHECYAHTKVLKFAGRKEYYKNKLREMTGMFNVKVIDYFIAEDRVLLLTSPESGEIFTNALRWLHGAISCNYNQRTNHCGVCWKPRYDISIVQNGTCMKSILPNISANVMNLNLAEHSAEYKYTGYKELAGIAKRYKIINQSNLVNAAGFDSFSEFSEWYIAAIEETIRNKHLHVDIIKNIFAYGNKNFIGSIAKIMPNSWYSIQKTDNKAYQNNQNILTVRMSKKRKRELLKMVL